MRKQLKQEQLLKAQAVNKLAEIMNRKDMNINNSGAKNKNKVSSSDLRKKEKECRKLQQELTQVTVGFFILFFRDINIEINAALLNAIRCFSGTR